MWEERVCWPPAWVKMVSSRFKERLFNKRGRKGRQALGHCTLGSHRQQKIPNKTKCFVVYLAVIPGR